MSVLRKLANELKHVKEEKANVALLAKELSKRDTEISEAILDEMENNGFTRVETDDILISSIKKKVAKIVDKQAFNDFVFNTKCSSLVSTRISTTFLEELAAENENIDGVEIIELNKLSFKKGSI